MLEVILSSFQGDHTCL